jgi:drug/metabolite transporter (DMT)-like permease
VLAPAQRSNRQSRHVPNSRPPEPPLSSNPQLLGALFGLCAAASFGLAAPLAKRLLGEFPPVLLAGVLYLGATVALASLRALGMPKGELALGREDVAKLAGVVVSGGVLGPVLMLIGLARVSALSASLLLNLEAPLTMLLSVAVFGEHLGRRAALAATFILVGALVLQLKVGALSGDRLGFALLTGACACWALDNNLTQRLTHKDPFAIVQVKTLVAGIVNTSLGLFALPGRLPAWPYVAGALLLGAMSYGVSVVLDAYALRHAGAAREAAYFATAPFVGAAASVLLLGDRLALRDVLAMAAMAGGVILLVGERHSHRHAHAVLEHAHRHTHDAHHQHSHDAHDPAGEPHTHAHRHEPLFHEHAHIADEHHRHRH